MGKIKTPSNPEAGGRLGGCLDHGFWVSHDEVTQGLRLIEVRPAVVAHFGEVVPHVASAEVHAAIERCMLVWAGFLLQKRGEINQIDPASLVATAFAAGHCGDGHISRPYGLFPHRRADRLALGSGHRERGFGL